MARNDKNILTALAAVGVGIVGFNLAKSGSLGTQAQYLAGALQASVQGATGGNPAAGSFAGPDPYGGDYRAGGGNRGGPVAT